MISLKKKFADFIESNFWMRFKRNRVALFSAAAFLVLLMISTFAQLIANDRPIVMTYEGEVFFPVFKDYLPKEFGKEGFVVDYLRMEKEASDRVWMLFPPIKHKPYDQNLNFEDLPAPPGATSVISEEENFEGIKISHFFGTDTGGRDLITRLIYGCQTSFLMAFTITLFSMLLGVSLGSLMGYLGGRFDLWVGRLLETLGYFPVIFLIIILVAFTESTSIWGIVFIFAFIGLSPYAYYMRGQVLKVRKQTFVEAAHALGQSDFKILFSHILPNALGPVLVLIPFTITGNISFLATIDFLGFGVQPPTASLGNILRSGYDDFANRWWLVAGAAVILVTILLLVNFIGEGIRDGLDPHAGITKKRIKELEEERQRGLHVAS